MVDLALPVEQTAEIIGRAARKSGFFYVKNHGVSEDLLARQFACSREYFDLPLAKKLKLKTNDANRCMQILHLEQSCNTSSNWSAEG